MSAGAMDIWTVSPMERVYPDSVRPKQRFIDEHLYAAAGEYESVQLVIRAGDEALENVRVTAPAPDNTILAPVLRRVGYVSIPKMSPRGIEERDLWPDPLYDYAPFDLPPNTAAALWVTYYIPRDAGPGDRTGIIRVETGAVSAEKSQKTAEIALKITVYDFEIPQVPSLRTAFPLDRKAVRSFYGIDDTDLEAWKPIYESLAPYRLSYRVWDGTEGLVKLTDGGFDAFALKAHLQYAACSAHMSGIDVGGGPGGLGLFPAPDASDPAQDPLQAYLRNAAPWLMDAPPGGKAYRDPIEPFLNDLADWLEARNWLDRAYIEPVVLPERALWQTVRDKAFRVRIHENRIPRLLAADVHPFFERYTRIWAMPLCRYDPHADQRLRQGMSLMDMPEAPAESVAASSSGRLPRAAGAHESYVTVCSEACDGSVFTYWVSERRPTPKKPEWLEVKLKQPVKADTIRIIWKTGCEAAVTDVYKVEERIAPRRLDFEWEEYPPVVAHGQTWLMGTLEEPQEFSTLRLEFSESCNGGPVGVSEVVVGEAEVAPPERFAPVEPWLFMHEEDFPSFHVDAAAAEFRLAPWVCHAQRMSGFMHSGLNKWPEQWLLQRNFSAVVESPNSLNGVLFYPGPDGLVPSIRAELLRDGLEDYEYLRLAEKAVDSGKIKDKKLVETVRPEVYSAWIPAERVEKFAETIPTQRKALGRALSRPDRRAGKGRQPK